MLHNLVLKNRSYRRFYQSAEITEQQLKDWVNLARLSASGRNAQPIKYILSCEKSKNEKIFSTLAWAAFLTDWSGPVEDERPSAYIIQLLDTTIANQFFCDDGIAAQSILLGAVESEFGGCIFRSINKPQLMQALKIPEQYQIINVIALGKPKEEVVIEEIQNGDFKYWRDEINVHHVPKRSLTELILPL
ncbi:MAG: nitroreductase [Prolixibacteraceae bacterium]